MKLVVVKIIFVDFVVPNKQVLQILVNYVIWVENCLTKYKLCGYVLFTTQIWLLNYHFRSPLIKCTGDFIMLQLYDPLVTSFW